jgi:hypothetical protein
MEPYGTFHSGGVANIGQATRQPQTQQYINGVCMRSRAQFGTYNGACATNDQCRYDLTIQLVLKPMDGYVE